MSSGSIQPHPTHTPRPDRHLLTRIIVAPARRTGPTLTAERATPTGCGACHDPAVQIDQRRGGVPPVSRLPQQAAGAGEGVAAMAWCAHIEPMFVARVHGYADRPGTVRPRMVALAAFLLA